MLIPVSLICYSYHFDYRRNSDGQKTRQASFPLLSESNKFTIFDGFIVANKIAHLVAFCALLMLLQGCINSGVPELRKPALLKEDTKANESISTPTIESPVVRMTPTPSPTPTQIPATPSPVPLPTSTPTPTQTPLPTSTLTPTNTPTSTPVVTPTVTPSVCNYAQLVLMGAGKDHDPCYTTTPTPKP